MLESYQARYPAPFAVLGIRTVGEWLTDIEYLPRGAATLDPTTRLAGRVCRQIERYLDDPDYRFDLPFEFSGTAFQRRVWQAICAIPRGPSSAWRRGSTGRGTSARTTRSTTSRRATTGSPRRP